MARYTPVTQTKPPTKGAVTPVSAGGRLPQISPPPVYRPLQNSVAVQSKVVKPTAPPVYRPENVVPRATPPVMQPKASKVAAPPVYRPENVVPRTVPPVMQPKTSRVAAPPVYRPEAAVPRAMPPIMQLKANKIAPSPALPTQMQSTAGQVPGHALRAGAPPVYRPQQPVPQQQTVQRVSVKRGSARPSPSKPQPQGQIGPLPWLQSQSLQLSKRKRGTVNYNEDEDEYAYLEEEGFGENPDYGEQLEAYTKQQVKKRKLVKEDPNATQITYQQSTGDEQTLTVRGFDWMKDNWSNVKGNLTFGTYAMSINVGGSPFYFRANNTMDVGLSPMTVGDPTEEGTTYVSSKARTFQEIGYELDFAIKKAKSSYRAKLRAEVGRSILKAIEGAGSTTVKFKGLDSGTQLLIKELIAELSGIWLLDLYRSEGNEKKVLKHQKELLESEMSFAEILKPGVYMGMNAKDLR